jgi:hypothetical protein
MDLTQFLFSLTAAVGVLLIFVNDWAGRENRKALAEASEQSDTVQEQCSTVRHYRTRTGNYLHCIQGGGNLGAQTKEDQNETA